ncbi:hypothetical protein [Sphingomonas morindae]|uniref:XRE family transcriptional regulator n=1 Tax=Sphingomonas morindae TaxID=1541170 RepID=A0ABY4X432_9SPHN|nr:hypothetical protein [Sphingomonas morindae]USI71636.1 hypothetical protein LHA26_09835 [Sphingomonas morindae]
MSEGQIHPRYRTVSASTLIETLGASLARIKDEDKGTTDADLGVVLGKSKDRAESYRKGHGDMGVVSFLRGCREWDGRFANDVLALVGMKLVPLETSPVTDRDTLPALTDLLHQVAVALADDGKIDDRELDAMCGALDAAGRTIDMLRERRRARGLRLLEGRG